MEKLTVEAINNVQLESLIENSLHVDGPQNLHKLNFANVTGKIMNQNYHETSKLFQLRI